MLRREWYESVSAEELAAIKQAMVGGPRGIATHAGHWYNCQWAPGTHISLCSPKPLSSGLVETYPSLNIEATMILILVQFAIGECGMPMEQARCPECGAPIGGSNHRAVEGVSRAMDMET